MGWRTLTIFIEDGRDIEVTPHGQFAQWELEAILMRALEKVSQEDIKLDIEEEVPTSDEDGQETSD